ncbi:MAG: ATP-binding protein [Beijerinckiaceae bacterium]|jgi:two-component system OmpR family sensor kinase|nr:ATP-binding protein [Beijerinckiaceae bacterium]
MRRWFDTLAARTVLLMLIGVGIVHVASLYAYQHALDREMSLANEARLADRLLTIRRSVMRVVPAERESAAHELSGGPVEAHWSATERARPGGPGAEAWQGLHGRLKEQAAELVDEDIIIGANRKTETDPHLALISLRLPDESWVNITLFAPDARPQSSHGTWVSTSLMALGVAVISVLVIGWMTTPLRRFASAARQLYHGTDRVEVPETGPQEIRDAAVAFNEMQARIRKLVAARTQTLAAVSHDLKTPLTRMRLRAEVLADRAQAEGLVADIREMERMLDQTLAHLRGDRKDEELRPLDLAALLATLANEAVDQGATASLAVPGAMVIEGRPLALKRAFGNLIDNAIKYGGLAEITVEGQEDALVVSIADAGPGIPEPRMAEMFEPFTRLETSRSRETGGFGLGLSIARDIIEGHGGTIALANRRDGGLLVTIRLPNRLPTPA